MEWKTAAIALATGIFGNQGWVYLMRHRADRKVHVENRADRKEVDAATVAVALMTETYKRVGVLEERTDNLEDALRAEREYTDRLVAHIKAELPPPPPSRAN